MSDDNKVLTDMIGKNWKDLWKPFKCPNCGRTINKLQNIIIGETISNNKTIKVKRFLCPFNCNNNAAIIKKSKSSPNFEDYMQNLLDPN